MPRKHGFPVLVKKDKQLPYDMWKHWKYQNNYIIAGTQKVTLQSTGYFSKNVGHFAWENLIRWSYLDSGVVRLCVIDVQQSCFLSFLKCFDLSLEKLNWLYQGEFNISIFFLRFNVFFSPFICLIQDFHKNLLRSWWKFLFVSSPLSNPRKWFWIRYAVKTWLCNISHSALQKDVGKDFQNSGGFSCLAEAPVVAID